MTAEQPQNRLRPSTNVLVIVAALITAPASESVSARGLTGTFTGTGTSTELYDSAYCPKPTRDSFNVKLTFSPAGNKFTAKGQASSSTDSVTVVMTNVTLSSGGAVAGTVTADDATDNTNETGSFTGKLSGDTLNFTFNVTRQTRQGCSTEGTVRLKRNGAIVPETATGTDAVTTTLLQATVSTTPALATTRLHSVFLILAPTSQAPSASAVAVTDGFLLQQQMGGSAGDGFDYPWGAWVSYSYSEYEDDFVSTAFDADRYSITGGLDFSPWDNMVAGFSLGYESNNIDTAFNSGAMDVESFTLAPYAGLLVSDQWSADLSVGFSTVDTDQFRTFGGVRTTSSVDAERRFIAGNLNYYRVFDSWTFSARGGLLYARENQDAYTESDGTINAEREFKFGQASVGGELAWVLDGFEPYASASYQYDYSRDDIVVVSTAAQPANDKDDFLVGAGVRWFGLDGFTAVAEWSTVVGREDFEDTSVRLLLRGDF